MSIIKSFKSTKYKNITSRHKYLIVYTKYTIYLNLGFSEHSSKLFTYHEGVRVLWNGLHPAVVLWLEMIFLFR